MLAMNSSSARRDGAESTGRHSGSQPGSEDSWEVTQRSKSCTACHRKVGESLTTMPSRWIAGLSRIRRKSSAWSAPTTPLTCTGAYRDAASAKYTAEPPRTSRRPAGVVTSSLWNVPATATSQVTRDGGSPRGGGPVAGSVATAGKGYGVGPGEGSQGILKDPEFLLYYNTVQDQIKKAWNFTGGSNDLTATVDFAIGPDGTLTGAKVGTSSRGTAMSG